jgi:chromosome segregation ATPase
MFPMIWLWILYVILLHVSYAQPTQPTPPDSHLQQQLAAARIEIVQLQQELSRLQEQHQELQQTTNAAQAEDTLMGQPTACTEVEPTEDSNLPVQQQQQGTCHATTLASSCQPQPLQEVAGSQEAQLHQQLADAQQQLTQMHGQLATAQQQLVGYDQQVQLLAELEAAWLDEKTALDNKVRQLQQAIIQLLDREDGAKESELPVEPPDLLQAVLPAGQDLGLCSGKPEQQAMPTHSQVLVPGEERPGASLSRKQQHPAASIIPHTMQQLLETARQQQQKHPVKAPGASQAVAEIPAVRAGLLAGQRPALEQEEVVQALRSQLQHAQHQLRDAEHDSQMLQQLLQGKLKELDQLKAAVVELAAANSALQQKLQDNSEQAALRPAATAVLAAMAEADRLVDDLQQAHQGSAVQVQLLQSMLEGCVRQVQQLQDAAMTARTALEQEQAAAAQLRAELQQSRTATAAVQSLLQQPAAHEQGCDAPAEQQEQPQVQSILRLHPQDQQQQQQEDQLQQQELQEQVQVEQLAHLRKQLGRLQQQLADAEEARCRAASALEAETLKSTQLQQRLDTALQV